MAHLLFVDESGNDHQESPYETLAGICIKDASLWNLIQEIKKIQTTLFGEHYRNNRIELKAKKILKRKTYKLAQQLPKIDEGDLPLIAQECLRNQENSTKIQLTALHQAKILYAERTINACLNSGAKLFASIVDYRSAPPQLNLEITPNEKLLKSYNYLFERFYYFLEDNGTEEIGIVIFDELEKSKSHILLDQMTEYFTKTRKGYERSSQIIPEPFFVHSDLTVGVQLADLAAYILNWGFELSEITEQRRSELKPLVKMLCKMRVTSTRLIPRIREDSPVPVRSIAFINH